ncbi:transcriptional repressor [Sphingobacterium sp. JB170]|uniref:transcriptional repressor n=1 Tax=Sphingobacterium sp. JB170 TaxID=1434842 RepID=UPI00358FF84A
MDREAEAEDIWISIRSDGYEISISCVYQSLGILTQAGICVSAKVGNRRSVYRMHPDFSIPAVQ